MPLQSCWQPRASAGALCGCMGKQALSHALCAVLVLDSEDGSDDEQKPSPAKVEPKVVPKAAAKPVVKAEPKPAAPAPAGESLHRVWCRQSWLSNYCTVPGKGKGNGKGIGPSYAVLVDQPMLVVWPAPGALAALLLAVLGAYPLSSCLAPVTVMQVPGWRPSSSSLPFETCEASQPVSSEPCVSRPSLLLVLR